MESVGGSFLALLIGLLALPWGDQSTPPDDFLCVYVCVHLSTHAHAYVYEGQS